MISIIIGLGICLIVSTILLIRTGWLMRCRYIKGYAQGCRDSSPWVERVVIKRQDDLAFYYNSILREYHIYGNLRVECELEIYDRDLIVHGEDIELLKNIDLNAKGRIKFYN